MSDVLAGALCVFAALSAGSPTRARAAWQAGAGVVAACFIGGASVAAALLLAACAAFLFFRPARPAPSVPASMQSLLVTLAFIAWLLPDALRSNGAVAALAGGAAAAWFCLAEVRVTSTAPQRQGTALHLTAAGACAALAYAAGAEPGALAVLAVIAMLALIGAHLSLALGGAAGAPVASVMSGAAACGLAVAAADDGALVVACIALVIGCLQSSSLARLVRFVRQAP
ncbi:hypothetical protein AWB71_04335 [Caballeronia peredens]|nr:hypothetical protein AWB71_04335 [Caballeronia peredens]